MLFRERQERVDEKQFLKRLEKEKKRAKEAAFLRGLEEARKRVEQDVFEKNHEKFRTPPRVTVECESIMKHPEDGKRKKCIVIWVREDQMRHVTRYLGVRVDTGEDVKHINVFLKEGVSPPPIRTKRN